MSRPATRSRPPAATTVAAAAVAAARSPTTTITSAPAGAQEVGAATRSSSTDSHDQLDGVDAAAASFLLAATSHTPSHDVPVYNGTSARLASSRSPTKSPVSIGHLNVHDATASFFGNGTIATTTIATTAPTAASLTRNGDLVLPTTRPLAPRPHAPTGHSATTAADNDAAGTALYAVAAAAAAAAATAATGTSWPAGMQALLDRADFAIPVSLPARCHHDALPQSHSLSSAAARISPSSYAHFAGASAAMLAPSSTDDRPPSPTTAHSAGVLAQFALTMAAAAAASSSASMSPRPVYSVGPTVSMPLARAGGSGSLSSSLSTLSSGSVPDASHPSFLTELTPLAHPRMPVVGGNGASGKRAIPEDAEDRPVAKRLRSSRRADSQAMDGAEDDGEGGTDPDDEGDDHDHEPEHDDEGDGEDMAAAPPAPPQKPPTAGRRKRVRSSERRFICQHCQQSFKRSEHLKRHLRVHTGERPFACLVPGCAKTFSRTDNLAQHMKIHAKHAAARTAESQAAAVMAAAAAAVSPHHHHHHHLPPALAVAVPVHMSHAAAAAAAHAQYAHAANAYAAAPTPYMAMTPPHHHHHHAMRAPTGYPSAAAAAYAPRATHYAAMAAAVPHYPGAAAGYAHAPMPPRGHGQQPTTGHSPTGAAEMVISWVPVLSSAARPAASASVPPRSGAPISATPPPSGDDLGAAAGTPPPTHPYPGTAGAIAARGYGDAQDGAYGLVPPTPPHPQTGSAHVAGATGATTPPFPLLIPYSAGHDLAGDAGADYGGAGHAGYAMAATPWGPYQAFSMPPTSPAHATAASARGATVPRPTRIAAPTTVSKAQTAGSKRASSPAVAVAAVTADSSTAAPPPAGGELDSSQYLTLDDPE
ncbi:hypothetical protein AMAG_07446 [Allomyces macrogynus ATCC 38327]|uniref:C2H2-type domain-containing protein n=1 Tax=Allomyces macrogynus (strain ATCC 38327) TaxID=578462 RepID=A0A0L0SIC8_ALLM3|nr:hypothetical protein AMAG_07446 [Allomyces macrogynus ATCC 38327]|eukprot:KNE62204.1 hypothetical protein AMAG_07446 [Allomyces macrogynus ATCC 38327]